MSWLTRLMSPCLFSHEDPIKVVRGKKLVLVCPRCLGDLTVVLPGQRLKVKPQPIAKPKFWEHRRKVS